ncbi:MAG TPA: FecR family protein [Bryobacteraceae bacterium]|nr:FecR family protein [Bryobacteraceae bacterium]
MSGSVRSAARLLPVFAALAVVCSAQPAPPGNVYAARVLSLSGQVSVLRDGVPWVLNAGDVVQMQQVIVTGPDGSAMFRVSDGSTFEVYPNSTVVFRNNPPNWRDLIDLLVGRIRVHIEHFGGQPNFNRVHTPSAVISVRGTIFDVAVTEDDQTTIVAVEEGTVDVRHRLQGGEKVLSAGESIRVYRDEPLAQLGIDKMSITQRVVRGVVNALYMALTRNGPHSVPGVGGGSGGGTGSGQTPPPPPPNTPPPPPTAPPPAH